MPAGLNPYLRKPLSWPKSRQRRNDIDATPFIDHPLAVADMLPSVGWGRGTDLFTLQAGVRDVMNILGKGRKATF